MIAGTAGGGEDGAGQSVACAANNGRFKTTTEDGDRSGSIVVVDVPGVCRDRGKTSLAYLLSNGGKRRRTTRAKLLLSAQMSALIGASVRKDTP